MLDQLSDSESIRGFGNRSMASIPDRTGPPPSDRTRLERFVAQGGSIVRHCVIGVTLGVVAGHLVPTCASDHDGRLIPHVPLESDHHHHIDAKKQNPPESGIVAAVMVSDTAHRFRWIYPTLIRLNRPNAHPPVP